MDLRAQLQATLGSAYTLEHELGGGGMSRVFVADETRLGRKVVVKLLSPELAQGISAERFEREIRLAASLQQANIVPLLSAGDSAGMPFYTMPFVEGESLRARLRASGALSISQAVSVLRDVARALAYAHERGIVHRDIKPDNVLLSGGAAVVTDFGIAKAISASRTAGEGATLTQLGTSIGTPAYISPEQAAGDPTVDYRADLYSFGCMAYELLSGQPPFAGRTPQRMIAAHMGEKPQPLGELRPELPSALSSLVMRCLEKEADLRPQSATEVLAALEAATTSDAGHQAMPAILLGGPAMFRKALAVYALAFVVVAVVAKASIVGIGLPDWVFPGALIVMALGLPMILFTAYSQRVARRALTMSPTYTPGGSLVPHGTMATMAIKASPHLSWRRTTLGGIYAVGGFIGLVGVFMLLRALGIGPAGSLLASGRLANRDVLIVSDFRVKGADSSLGTVVSEAVRTQLGQSGVVNVLPPVTVAAALRRMQRPPTTQVDLALAREVGQREGAKAVVDGDVTPLGAGFIVSIRLVTVDSQAELATFHATANNAGDLLPTLDKLVRSLRGKMGESLKEIHAEPPLEQVTTASLDALRKFAEGRRANNIEGNFAKGLKLLEEAAAIDTTFAMAYRSLGIVYNNSAFPREKADSAFARAYRYRDRLSDKEKLLATSAYFGGPARDRGRGVAAAEEYMARYRDDYTIPNNTGLVFDSRRQFAHAESLFRRAIALNESAVLSYTNLLRNLVSQGRLDDADKLNEEIHRRFAGSPNVINLELPILWARGQRDSFATMLRATAASTSSTPQVKANSLNTLGALSLTEGRLAESLRLRSEGTALNRARGATASPLADAVEAAWTDAWFRAQPERAVRQLDSALAATPLRGLPVDSRNDFRIAGIYALAGRADKARATIAQFDADIKDTTLRRAFEPARHAALAEIAIAEHRAKDAVNEVRLSDQLPDGPVDACGPCFYATLGRAFDLAEMPDSAIATLERFLSTPLWNRFQLRADGANLAGVYKRLGELYEAKGDKQKAVSNYTKFVELWKNADPELQPKVAEVKRKLARLGDVEKAR